MWKTPPRPAWAEVSPGGPFPGWPPSFPALDPLPAPSPYPGTRSILARKRTRSPKKSCTKKERARLSPFVMGMVRGASPNFGSPAQRVPKFLPFPARPAGGRAVTGVGQMGRRPGKKRRRTSAGSPQTRKGGSREEEPLPPWRSFLRLSPGGELQ